MTPLLDVRDLTITFGQAGASAETSATGHAAASASSAASPGGATPAVKGVTFQVAAGETLGLVGESGSGKSVTAFGILRLLQPPGRVTGGQVLFEGRDLLTLSEKEMRAVRGARISLIFQEPMTALNPVMRVGDQIAEALTSHGLSSRNEARARAVELLESVRIPDPARRARDYPHQLSGGMRQRVMIAIALACEPPLVIADEPTTALDVTIQAQVLDLLREMRARYHLALLLITHDFGVIAEMADRVAVMYKGTIVEQGPVRQILRNPQHEYTQSLLRAVPGMPFGADASPGLGVQSTSGIQPNSGNSAQTGESQ
jgi:ABC-type dipeptide/oligopeptide/nickel transport system ATPase component